MPSTEVCTGGIRVGSARCRHSCPQGGKLDEPGSLIEIGAGYTLYWSAGGPEEHRPSAVAFMVKQSLAKKLLDIPVGHSDRLKPRKDSTMT
ncbi:craniofacial development protein 2 [Biomphalaria glabrata]|nr:craniofacial development protein 2-like [Biomphalaria glabrata]